MTKLKRNLWELFALVVAVAATNLANPAWADTFTGKVVSVVDGDTLNILNSAQKEKVILYGIDCPEQAQEFGKEARDFTDSHCYGKTVTVEEHGKDSRGRIIAVIYLADGTNLNQTLVAQGLAWWSDKYAPNDGVLKRLFTEAKAQHKGLWTSSNPIAPWIFRNGQRDVQAQIMPK